MGSVNLDNTGSGSAITLSSDGTSLLLDGTAIGGGGADLYAESLSGATSPTATGTNSVAIGSDAQATATNGSIAFGTATRATGNANVAIGYQANAAGVGALATGYLANAAADFSTAVGRNAKTATGSNATALTNSYASGANSFAAAIASNSSSYGASGANSVAMGSLAKATGIYSVTMGGSSNQATSTGSAILGGFSNTASGSYSRAGGLNALADEYGEDVWANGNIASQGDAQTGKVVLRTTSYSGAGVRILYSDGSSLRWTISNNSAYIFTAMFVARRKASEGTESAAIKFEGLLRKEGNDASITLVSSAKTIISNAPGWTVQIFDSPGSSGEDNGGLDVVFFDSNGWNIYCVCTIEYTKVAYA